MLLERPHPTWTVSQASAIFYRRKDNPAAAAELAALPELSTAWREALHSVRS